MPTPHRAGLRNLAPSRPILPHLAPSRARCTGCFGRSTRWRGRRGKPPTVRAERPRRPTGRWPTRWSAPTRSSTSFPWSASSRRIRRPPPRSAETSRGLPWTALGTAGRYLALARLTETHHFRPFFFSFCPPPAQRCLSEGRVSWTLRGSVGVACTLLRCWYLVVGRWREETPAGTLGSHSRAGCGVRAPGGALRGGSPFSHLRTLRAVREDSHTNLVHGDFSLVAFRVEVCVDHRGAQATRTATGTHTAHSVG